MAAAPFSQQPRGQQHYGASPNGHSLDMYGSPRTYTAHRPGMVTAAGGHRP